MLIHPWLLFLIQGSPGKILSGVPRLYVLQIFNVDTYLAYCQHFLKRIDFISRKMNRCYIISKGWLTRKLIDDLIFKFSWDDGSLKFRAKISWFDVHKDLRETEEEKNSWNYYGMHTYMLCQLEHYGCFWILLSKKYLIQISILGTNMHHVHI